MSDKLLCATRIIKKDTYYFCKECNKLQYHKAYMDSNYIYYFCYYHNILNIQIKKNKSTEKPVVECKNE